MKNLEKATFGAGCFWHVEETFRKVNGVISTSVGFMGGDIKNPSYEEVSQKKTGHAEVLHFAYDPTVVSYKELLNIFWENHDPTTLNRQGPDVGNQYRSVIFFHTLAQEKIAKESKDELVKSGKLKDPIVTEIVPAGVFYKAEEYHQRYLEKRGLATCDSG
jgi:peptide-methionine (S)-S-oxide reductase